MDICKFPLYPSSVICPLTLLAHVMIAAAAVETAGAQAAGLETCVRSRRGTGRCARASRRAPCRRARCARRAARGSPTDNPRLLLRLVSKAWQIVEPVVACHGTSPFVAARLVSAAGFEPAASCSQGRRSPGLSYTLELATLGRIKLPTRASTVRRSVTELQGLQGPLIPGTGASAVIRTPTGCALDALPLPLGYRRQRSGIGHQGSGPQQRHSAT